MIGRLVELVRVATTLGHRMRTLHLAPEDELLLRDVDAHQLGAGPASIASHGSVDEWRAVLRQQFRLRYDLLVVFDAKTTKIAFS